MENIKELVDKEAREHGHFYLYTAMRVVAKKLKLSETTINNYYYRKPKKETKETKFKIWANNIIDWTLVREDHIDAFIEDTEKLITSKLRMAYNLGKTQEETNE